MSEEIENNDSMILEDKETTELVKKEAEDYYKLAKSYRDLKWMKQSEDVNIIDRKWMKKWKEYVNYSKIKQRLKSYFGNKYNKNELLEVFSNLKPGQVNNFNILVPLTEFLNDGNINDQMNIVLREGLSQRDDIRIISKEMWEFFIRKYGGGPTIIRAKIPDGTIYSSRKIVELAYKCFNFVILPERRKMSKDTIHMLKPVQFYSSRTKSLSEVKEKLVGVLNANLSKSFKVDNFKLWNINENSSLEEFKDFLIKNLDDLKNTDSQIECDSIINYLEYFPEITLKDIELADTDTCIVEYLDDSNPVVFEVKIIEYALGKCDWCSGNKLLKFNCPCKDVAYCSELCKENDYRHHSNRCKRSFKIEEDTLKVSSCSKNGLVGLQNLGNTCFMNTSLQCMSNCPELSEYFLKDYYKNHINEENPIGTHGVLARSYSNLLKNLWYGTSNVYSPWNFKSAISTFQSMFTGFQQHDTQEFLNYLLDGLHEDLNKVKNKPIIEKDDTEKDDETKSKEQWIGYLKRNQSCLVDLLYGQYKSTLFCPNPECKNVSTTFDPFLSLTLPLASKGQRYELACFFIFFNIEIKAIHIDIDLYSETPIIAIRNKLAKLLNIHPYSFVILQMNSSGDLNMILNSNHIMQPHEINKLRPNEKPLFCFQIDPQIFYNPNNHFGTFKSIDISQLRDFSQTFDDLENSKQKFKDLFSEDYEEDLKGITNKSTCYYSLNLKESNGLINVDSNYGLSTDWIKLILFVRKYEENDDLDTNINRLIFPRVIYINKKWSLKTLHLTILNYFSSILRRSHTLGKDTDLWDYMFLELEEILKTTTEMNFKEHKSKLLPYLVKIRRVNNYYNGSCVFCESKECCNCFLPCNDTQTVENLLNKIPVNGGMYTDNTYFYMNNKERLHCCVPNSDFSLDIVWLAQYVNEVKKLNEKKDFMMEEMKAMRPESIKIANCFKNFCLTEKLEEDNAWYCPKCKQHQLADKRMEIYKSPNILIVHLKRFRNNRKIDTVVDFPIEGLDISKFVKSQENELPLVYDLFAIANHYGSLYGGHYVAYAKNYLDKSWYCFNDSSVSSIQEDQLVSSSAYVLFYRRRNLNQLVSLNQIYEKEFEDFKNNSDRMRSLSIDS